MYIFFHFTIVHKACHLLNAKQILYCIKQIIKTVDNYVHNHVDNVFIIHTSVCA